MVNRNKKSKPKQAAAVDFAPRPPAGTVVDGGTATDVSAAADTIVDSWLAEKESADEGAAELMRELIDLKWNGDLRAAEDGFLSDPAFLQFVVGIQSGANDIDFALPVAAMLSLCLDWRLAPPLRGRLTMQQRFDLLPFRRDMPLLEFLAQRAVDGRIPGLKNRVADEASFRMVVAEALALDIISQAKADLLLRLSPYPKRTVEEHHRALCLAASVSVFYAAVSSGLGMEAAVSGDATQAATAFERTAPWARKPEPIYWKKGAPTRQERRSSRRKPTQG